MRAILFAGGILFVALLVWLLRNSRFATPTVPFKVVRTEGPFAVRDYPERTVAMTPMAPGQDSGSFGRLFAFITGKNTKSEKIPMTTPVLIGPSDGQRVMSFVMPEEVARNGVPEPSGGEVRLRILEPGRYAVMSFKGKNDEKSRIVATRTLRTWLETQKITAQSEPVFAYYDPPWTPRFLRRNEVMVRVGNEVK